MVCRLRRYLHGQERPAAVNTQIIGSTSVTEVLLEFADVDGVEYRNWTKESLILNFGPLVAESDSRFGHSDL